MKTIITITTLLVIGFFAECANGQGAWVCWHKQSNFCYTKTAGKMDAESSLNETKWEIMEAYPRYDQCVAAIHFHLADYFTDFGKNLPDLLGKKDQKNLKISGGVDKGFVLITIDDQKSFISITDTFHCYPESVDPRK